MLQELASVEVEIPDPNLERAIREKLGLPDETPLTQLLMRQLTEVNAPKRNIADLAGLEHATNLTVLSVWGNPISDISPLVNLIQLRYLDLAAVK